MKKKMQKKINFIVTMAIAIALLFCNQGTVIPAQATTISEVENIINQTQNQISIINEHLNALTEEQELIEEKIDDLNAEIINTMTSIGMKEDEIQQKELELEQKQGEIAVTQQEYYAAKEKEEKQQADMVVRLRRMYENDKSSYLNLIMSGKGLGDLLNQMDYIEKIYEYDRNKLTEFENTKNLVHDLWNQLENEKEALEIDKAQLVLDREALENQKSSLDSMLAQKRRESANYEAEIKRATQEASVAKKLLQQEQRELKKLQDAANRGNNSSAANINYTTTNYTEIINAAVGSDLGKKIAKYGCQYIGNPYVYGGTSLTKGADCSGFIYRIYSDFGYSISRTSYEQRKVGTGVEYKNAQPGDIICYDGHVGLYIGGGLIVHASSAKTGIKVSKATYRNILAVRRVIE